MLLNLVLSFFALSGLSSARRHARDIPVEEHPTGYPPYFTDYPPAKGLGPNYDPVPRVIPCLQLASPIYGPRGLMPISKYGLPEEPLEAPRKCARVLMDQEFNADRLPYAARYEPPHECVFNRVLLNYSVYAEGTHLDHMAILYLNDVEILRTTTAQPREAGIKWEFWKDMTAYIALWNGPHTFIFDMPMPKDKPYKDKNYKGSFRIKITAVFFNWDYFEINMPKKHNNWPGPPSAHQILPINARRGENNLGSAWIYPDKSNDTSTTHLLPRNLYRAHVSIAATGHGKEEFWWANVPNSVARTFENNTGLLPGDSGYREIHLYIDEHLAGVVWPFPMVFAGGIAAPLHRPMVPLQAFDIREHEIDITHWLGYLCDGTRHKFSLRVFAIDDTDPGDPRVISASSYWVVSAKLFLWEDPLQAITNGTIPEVITNDFVFEKNSNVKKDGSGDNVAVGYETALRRRFKTRGSLVTPNRHVELTVEQNLDATNKGMIEHRGMMHRVNATYKGESKASEGHRPFFFSGWRYPIASAVEIQQPADGCKFRLNAELYQAMDITMTEDTAFPLGIEAWRDTLLGKWDMVSGSSISAYRQAYATMCEDEDGRMNTGHGNIRGSFRLGAVDHPQPRSDFLADPLLYQRAMATINETIVYDAVDYHKIGNSYEFIRDGQRPSAMEEAKLNPPGGYAPLGDNTWRPFMGKFIPRGPKLWEEEEAEGDVV